MNPSDNNEPKEPMNDNEMEELNKKRKNDFENMVQSYLDSNPFLKSNNKNSELEIRFGTNTKLSRPLSKIDYDNVVKQLIKAGFKAENIDGLQLLRINSEYTDRRTGQVKMSNIRAEIVGTDLIQEYCRTNSIDKILTMPSTTYNKMKFTQKTAATNAKGEIIQRLDMNDFNFRVSYQMEQDYSVQTPIARGIIDNWNDKLKTFRLLNRVRFAHPEYPVFADISILKSSQKTNHVPIPKYDIQQANVFENMPTYEIELEIDNSRVGKTSRFDTTDKLMKAIRKCIMVVLSGLQMTQFPISYPEKNQVLQSYMRLFSGEEYKERFVKSKDFIGPSSMTLQLENIQPENQDSNIINIRQDYTVTDKADGERKMLFINETGKIYMIDTNMNVIFTGTKTRDATIFNTLIDGEHIKTDKNGNLINLYAAFDVYYINKVSVRSMAFLPNVTEVEEGIPQFEEPTSIEESKKTPKIKIKCNAIEIMLKYRLPLLNCVVDLIKPLSVVNEPSSDGKGGTKSTDFRVNCKKFYNTSQNFTIFDGCAEILSKINTKNNEGSFEYNTDGLIFTPSYLPVGGSRVGGESGVLRKTTWKNSFKWKPPEFNTIDFLVTMKKDNTGKDEVHHILQDGRNLQGIQDVIQYKTLVLRCGFNEKEDGYMNPFQSVINDDLPKQSDVDNEDSYKPVPFQPTNPYDPNACFTNILLKEEGSKLFMTTEEDQYFEENMIVEFKYEKDNTEGWKWVPLRVRYDKTAELNSGQRNYGNAYRVANSNWHSIHNPITEQMIRTGKDIPEQIFSEEVYYNRSNDETSTQGMRNFHNLYVKKKLIQGVSNRGDTIIDYAVGKAGDISKWVTSGVGFVFGIDISKDNIHNKMDGACARYLTSLKKYPNMCRALFVNGDSKLNIRDGTALLTEKDKQISRAVFGVGPKDMSQLGKGVYNQYGVAEHGFGVSSCQFALHYFFENETTFHGFMRNLAECTKINGYFIGTCYDGRTVFNLLSKKNKDESIAILKEDRKIFEMTKLYDETGFPDDELSLGYAINVYQESINKVFREYLVNFEFLKRIMEDYGFVLVNKEQSKSFGLTDGTGLFQELFKEMKFEIKNNPSAASNYKNAQYMSPEEQQISFMNRYFIFKKVRNINVKKLHSIIATEKLNNLGDLADEMADLEQQTTSVKETENAEPTVTMRIRKTKKGKVTLKTFNTVSPVEISELPPKAAEEVVAAVEKPSSPTTINVQEPTGEIIAVNNLEATEPAKKIIIKVKKTKKT
jgi:hypothetical protein